MKAIDVNIDRVFSFDRKKLRGGDRLKFLQVERMEIIKPAEDGAEFDDASWGAGALK